MHTQNENKSTTYKTTCIYRKWGRLSLSASRIAIATEKVEDVGEAINVDFCIDYDMSILFRNLQKVSSTCMTPPKHLTHYVPQ